MMTMTRRKALKCGVAGALSLIGGPGRCSLFASSRAGDDEITGNERDQMGVFAEAFRDRFGVPGLSIAIARNGNLVYREPFGFADRVGGEKLSSNHLFRIASVSKTLTAVAIFNLVQSGTLDPQDLVFGTEKILVPKYRKSSYRKYVEDITVDHLLTHTCGGWEKGTFDPMFCWSKVDVDHLISWIVDNRPLDYPPGDRYAYSNFGYCLLGRVIEVRTGRTYREYVKNEILSKAGVADMQIGENKRSEHSPKEVVYKGQNGENPYDVNVDRLDSAGGWIATATDLVRFASNVDKILSSKMINEMTTRTKVPLNDPTRTKVTLNDSKGWNIAPEDGTWFHNGSLPGTASVIVRTPTGLCLAAVANTRYQPSDEMDGALYDMMLHMSRLIQSGTT